MKSRTRGQRECFRGEDVRHRQRARNRMTFNFSKATTQQWNKVFKFLKENNFQCSILCLSKPSIKCESKNKYFQTRKVSIKLPPFSQKLLGDVLHQNRSKPRREDMKYRGQGDSKQERFLKKSQVIISCYAGLLVVNSFNTFKNAWKCLLFCFVT